MQQKIPPPKETKSARLARDVYGNRTVNQYVILKELGRGTFGKVKLCINTEDNEFYAVKILRKRQLSKKRIGMVKGGALQDALNEIELMKSVRHKNIITLYEVIDDPGEDKLFLFMEYADGGSILTGEMETEPIPEDKARRYFIDVLNGLDYLHKQSIIHRDIKPENILLVKDVAKISDFGVAIRLSSDNELNKQLLKRTVGSPAFLPPELCASENSKLYGAAIDMWCLGITLYFFIFGKPPFVGENEMQLYENIRTKEVEFPKEIDGDLQHLILSLLRKDPERRATMEDSKKNAWVNRATSC